MNKNYNVMEERNKIIMDRHNITCKDIQLLKNISLITWKYPIVYSAYAGNGIFESIFNVVDQNLYYKVEFINSESKHKLLYEIVPVVRNEIITVNYEKLPLVKIELIIDNQTENIINNTFYLALSSENEDYTIVMHNFYDRIIDISTIYSVEFTIKKVDILTGEASITLPKLKKELDKIYDYILSLEYKNNTNDILNIIEEELNRLKNLDNKEGYIALTEIYNQIITKYGEE